MVNREELDRENEPSDVNNTWKTKRHYDHRDLARLAFPIGTITSLDKVVFRAADLRVPGQREKDPDLTNGIAAASYLVCNAQTFFRPTSTWRRAVT